MRAAVLSDIHANPFALQAVLEDCERQGVSHYLILGDLVGYYYWPRKVLDLLNGVEPKTVIQGNHERLLAVAIQEPAARDEIEKELGRGIETCFEQLEETEINWLISLPERQEIALGGRQLLLCHGAPFDRDAYVYPTAALDVLQACCVPEVDFVLQGHTHYPLSFANEGVHLINPGSVGQPRDIGGAAAYGILNLENRVWRPRRIPYPLEPILEGIDAGDPNGRYLRKILTRR